MAANQRPGKAAHWVARFGTVVLWTLLSTGCGDETEPILVALAGPLSEARGASALRGAELALAEINSGGGIGGRPLALVAADDSGTTDAAIRVARDLYDDGRVAAVIGHFTSETTLAAASVYNAGSNPLVEITPSATSPAISDREPYTFGLGIPFRVHGNTLARWAFDNLAAQQVATIYRADDYGRGIQAAFGEEFSELGGHVVTDLPYLPEIPSFVPFLIDLQTSGGIDVLLLAGLHEAAERVLAAIDSMDLAMSVVGTDALSGLEESGVIDEGTVFVSSEYFSDMPGERNELFVNTFRLAYDGRFPDRWSAVAYDIMHLVGQALAAVGPSRDEVREYLSEIGSTLPAFEGVTRTLAFDEVGIAPAGELSVGLVANGQLATAGAQ